MHPCVHTRRVLRPRPLCFSLSRLSSALAVTALLVAESASGANNLFDGPGSIWADPANWSLGTAPGVTDALLLDGAFPATTLDGSFTSETLSFNSGALSLSIDASSTGAIPQLLTLSGGTNALGGTDVIATSSTTTGTISIGATPGSGVLTLALPAAASIDVNHASANLIFGASSVLSGTTLTKNGAGTLELGGLNTYTGLTTVSAGTLRITDVGALGTAAAGTTVADGATLQINATGTVAGEALTLNGVGVGGAGALVVNNSSAWTGSVNIATASTINVGTAATWTATAANVAVNAGLTKVGAGTMQLTGGITTGTGTLAVNGGDFVIDASSRWNSGAIAVNTGGTLRTTGGGDSIGNTVTVTVNAGGVLDLQQNGATETVQQLFLNGTGIGGTGAFVNNAAGTTTTFVSTSPITLQSATTIGGAGNITTASQINAGGFRLTKAGAGTFTLNASNSSVGLTIAGGTWDTNTETSLGAAPGAFSANSVVLDGGTLSWRNGAALTTNTNRGIAIGASGGSILLNNAGLGNLTLAQVISDDVAGAGPLTLGGTSTSVLVMQAQSTYSGGTILAPSSGLVVPTVSSTFAGPTLVSGPFGTGPITFAGGRIRSTTNTAQLVGNDINFAADTTIPSGGADKVLTFSGGVTLTGGSRILTQSSTADVVMSGIIGDGGNTLGLTKTGAGRLVLSGANTYSGQTVVTQGILNFNSVANVGGGASALGAPTTAGNGVIVLGNSSTNAAVTLQFSGTVAATSNRVLDLANTTAGITLDASGAAGAPVAFTGGVTASGAGAKTLALTGTNTDANTLGAIVDSGGGATAVTKTGAGMWVLSGNNTYTGATLVNGAGGVLALTGDNTGSTSNATVTAGTLRVGATNHFTAGTLSLNAGTLDLRNDVSTTFAKDVTLTATSTINVDQAVGGVGSNQTNTLQLLTQATAAARTLNVTGGNGYRLTLANLNLAPLTGGTTTINPTTASVTIQNVTNTMSGFTSTNFDTLTLGGTSTGNVVSGVISDAAGGSAAAGGLTRLTKSGASTWTLTNTNSTYGGLTTISGGVLEVNSMAPAGANSSLGANGFILLSGGTLRYLGSSAATTDRFNDQGTNGSITANSTIDLPAGDLTLTTGVKANTAVNATLNKTGAGVLTLSGAVDNNGLLLSVGSGQVNLDKSGATTRAVAGVTVAPGATLKLTGTGGDQIFGGSAAANRGITALDGTLDLNGKNESTSNLVGASTGLVTNTSTANSVLTVGETNATSAFAGNIQNGAGRIALTKIGTGTQTLSGTNSYTGGNSITGGMLLATSSGSLAAYGRNTVVNSGATLGLDFAGAQNTLARSVNGISAGAFGIGANSAAENIDLSAAGANLPTLSIGAVTAGQTYSGTLTPNNNTYRLGNGNQLQLTGQLTDGPGSVARSVVITGNINFQQAGANTYTGGTTLQTGGILNFRAGTLSTGDVTFAGNSTLQWNSTNTAEDISAGRKITINSGATATLDTNGTSQTLASSIAGVGALTKAGAGNLTLAAANTYTGATTINAGTLTLAHTDALRSSTVTASTNLLFSSAAGGKITLGGLTGSAGVALQDEASAPITLEIGANNSAQTYSGVLSGPGGLTKLGSGTQTITGANTYAGATSIINGPGTSQQTVGALRLDFSAATPATNLINPSSTLSFGGSTASPTAATVGSGTLNLTGKASTTNSQAFAGTTLGAGGAGIVLAANATANPLALDLGAINRSRGATLDITQPTGTLSATNGVLTSTGTASTLLTDATGTAYAVVGNTDWAAKDATNAFITGLSTVSGYTTFSASGPISGNADVTASGTATSGSTFNSVRLNTGTPTLTLAGVNTISSGGVLFGNGLGGTPTITGGSIQPGAGAELVFINNTVTTVRTPVIASNIVNNGATPTNVTFRGNSSVASQFNITATGNTYSGITHITGGRVQSAQASPFGTSDVYINGNTDGQYMKVTTANTTNNHFYIVGNGWQETGGPFGAIRVDAGTIAGTITLLGDAGLGAQNSAGTISGTIEGGFNITKLGGNTLILSGANTYTGNTFVNAGTLQFNSMGAIGGTGASVTVNSGASVAFNFGADQAALNRLSSASAGNVALTAANANNLDFTNLPNVFLGANAASAYTGTLTPGSNGYRIGGGSNTLTLPNANQLTGNRNVSINGSVTLSAANDYTGATTISAGTVTFANGSLGTGDISVTANSTLAWAAGNTQDLSSGRTLSFAGGTATLSLGANNVTLAGGIAGGGGLSKSGAGTLTLSGTNTYTGGTAATAGNITISGGNAIPNGSVVTLTASASGGSLTLLNDETIGGLASTGTFAAGNAGVNLNANTLTFGNATATTYDGVITGTGGIVKTGTAVATIRNAQTYAGATAIQSGGVSLDFTQTFTPLLNLLPTGTALTLSGGTLGLTGRASTTNSQTFTNGVTLLAGANGLNVTNNATANPVALNLNGITRNAGATVNFTNPANGAISATNGITTTTLNGDFTSAGGSQTILGGYATVGNNTWAVTSNTAGTNNVTGLAAYDSFATPGTGRNIDVTGANAPGAFVANSLRFNAAAAASIDATGGLTVASGGILMTTAAAANAVSINSGTLTSGNGTDLVVFQHNTTAGGELTIGSQITGGLALTKSGAGTLILGNGSNEISAVSVNAGILQVNANGAIGNGPITFTGTRIALAGGVNLTNSISIGANTGAAGVGLVQALSGTVNLNGPITISANAAAGGHFGAGAGATLNVNGPITVTNPAVIVFSRAGSVVFSGGGSYPNFGISQDTTSLGAHNGLSTTAVVDVAVSAAGTLDLKGFNQTLGGLVRSAAQTATVTNSTVTTSTLTLDTASGRSFTYPGALTGNLNLVKDGAGAQTLSGANTYTGSTTVNAGTLIMGSNTALGNTQTASNALTVNGGTLDLNGVANLHVGRFSGTGGTIQDGSLTPGASTFSTASDSDSTFGGVIADGSVRTVALQKDGSGALTLTGLNTFTGKTDVYGGGLIVDGSISGSAVTVFNGAALSGDGVTGSLTVQSGGSVSPGSDVGLLSTGSLSLSLGSTLSFEINTSTPVTGYDQLSVAGGVSLSNASLQLDGSYLSGGDLFFLVLNDGADPISGIFNGLAEGSTIFSESGQDFVLTYFADAGTSSYTGGNDVALLAVPEPGVAVSLLAGLGLLLGRRRRREK